MPDKFDPYHEWLGITPDEQPPNHYRLLAIAPFEDKRTVIENAADQRMAHLRNFQAGKHSRESQRLLNEVAAARICLLNTAKKAAYDALLRKQIAAADRARSRSAKEEPSQEPFAGFDVADFTRPAATAAVASKSRPAHTKKLPRQPPQKKLPWQLPAAIAVALLACVAIWAYLASIRDENERAKTQARTADSRSSKKDDPGASTKSGGKKASHPEQPKPEPPKPEVRPEPRPEPPPRPLSPPPSTTDAPPTKIVRPRPEYEPKAQPDTKAKPTSPTAPVAPEKSKRLPFPSAAVQQEIALQIQEVYKLADANEPEEQIELAKDLVDVADKSSKPDEQFVLLRRAAELAGEAGDMTFMFKMVDRLGERFELDSLNVKEKLLTKLAAKANDAVRVKLLAEGYGRVVDQALSDERFDVAVELLKAASHLCQKVRGPQYRKEVVALRKEIQERQQQVEKLSQALAAARANPQDGEANLAVGKLYCFGKGNWAKGLPYLAKGSDEDLKSLALQETGPPGDAEAKIKLADGWWKLGQAAKGKAREDILLHAGTWYQEAEPSLNEGLTKARVEKRLEEIAALGREIPTISDKPPQPAVAPFDEKMAKRHQKLWARHLNVAAVQTNSLGMKLVLIPPGEFMMGSPRELIEAESLRPDTEEWYKHDISSEGPQHRVRITKPYWLGVTPVTQEEYQRVMGNNPSGFRGVPTRPVEQVSWVEAMDFCRKLSDLHEEKAAKRRYGLPTEAQWEYACRAGSTGRWCFSNQPNVSPGAAEEKLLDEYAWFTANASRRPHPVGQKRANAWGLYDMHGNVWQWCADWNGNPYYANSTTDDPAGPESGQFRVNRGGCWFMPAECSRSACRGCNLPEIRGATIGFRVCLLPASK